MADVSDDLLSHFAHDVHGPFHASPNDVTTSTAVLRALDAARNLGRQIALSGLTIAGDINVTSMDVGNGISFENCTLTGVLDLSRATVGMVNLAGTTVRALVAEQASIRHDLLLTGANLKEGVQLLAAKIDGELGLSNAKLGASEFASRSCAIVADRAEIHGSVFMRGTVCGGEARYTDARIDGSFEMDDARMSSITGESLRLNNSRIGRDVYIRNVTADGAMRLDSARVGGSVNIGHTRLSDPHNRAYDSIIAFNLEVDGNLLIRDCRTDGPINLQHVRVRDRVELQRSDVAAPSPHSVNLAEAEISGSLMLTSLRSPGGITLVASRTAGDVTITDCQVAPKDSFRWRGASVGGSLLVVHRVDGPPSLALEENRVGGTIAVDAARLGPLSMKQTTVGGVVDLSNCMFRDGITITSLKADDDVLLMNTGAPEYRLEDCEIKGGLDLRGIVSLGGVQVTGLTCEHSLSLAAASVTEIAIELSRVLGDVELTSAASTAVTMRRSLIQGSLDIGDLSADKIAVENTRIAGDLNAKQVRSRSSSSELALVDLTIDGNADLSSEHWVGAVRCLRTTCKSSSNLSFASCSSWSMQGTLFQRTARLVIGSQTAQFRTTSFLDFSDVRLQPRARASFEACDFSGEVVLGGPPGHEPTQLVELAACRVEGLRLHDIDMGNAALRDLQGADRMSLDGTVTLQSVPRTGLLAIRTRRLILADEIGFRAQRSARWISPVGWTDRQVTASSLRDLYRALRKSQEDIKNHPGAADFYYGEMEMRRLGARGVERLLLTAYWVVAGYGLRAWRAFALLMALVLAASFFLMGGAMYSPPQAAYALVPVAGGGYTVTAATIAPSSGPSFPDALIFSVQNVFAVIRPSASSWSLTPAGDAVALALRVLGPALIALALLAIRGRVRR